MGGANRSRVSRPLRQRGQQLSCPRARLLGPSVIPPLTMALENRQPLHPWESPSPLWGHAVLRVLLRGLRHRGTGGLRWPFLGVVTVLSEAPGRRASSGGSGPCTLSVWRPH